jgi:cellulose biosynthesis protein BcsQ
MNVIVFASRKGGSGKSTLTAHLAAHAYRPSRRCMLIDADPQGSISLWHKLRGTAEPQLRNGTRDIQGSSSRPRPTGSNGRSSIRRPTCPAPLPMRSASRRWL